MSDSCPDNKGEALAASAEALSLIALGHAAHIGDMIDETKRVFGDIDIFVNSAAVFHA